MKGKCAECGNEGEMMVLNSGLCFCNLEHCHLYRYKPNMTEETYEESTTLDEIELDSRTTMYLETPDGFYSLYSGYKAIITLHRGVNKPKQVGSYCTIAAAKADWEKYKKKHNLQSWADKNARQIAEREKKRPTQLRILAPRHKVGDVFTENGVTYKAIRQVPSTVFKNEPSGIFECEILGVSK